jgi:hypothetical protein
MISVSKKNEGISRSAIDDCAWRGKVDGKRGELKILTVGSGWSFDVRYFTRPRPRTMYEANSEYQHKCTPSDEHFRSIKAVDNLVEDRQ